MTESAANHDGRLSIFTLIAAVGGVEILFRLAVESSGLGDSLVAPVVFLLISNEVISDGIVGWLIGWFLFWSLLIYMSPELFPKDWLETANSLPTRIVTATAAVVFGIIAEFYILDIPDPLTPQFVAPSFELLLAVTGLTMLSFGVVSYLPKLTVGENFLQSTESSSVHIPDCSVSRPAFVIRSTVLVVLLGVLLAEVSLMYPFPEIYLLAIVISERFELSNTVFTRKELAERAALGATSVWAPLRFMLTTGYGIYILLIPLFMMLSLYNGIRFDEFARQPASYIILLLTWLVAIWHIIVYITRVFSRLRIRIHSHYSDTTDTQSITEPSRPPGFLLPAFVPLSVLAIFSTYGGNLGILELAIVLLSIAIPVLATYDTLPDPLLHSDDMAVPFAAALVTAFVICWAVLMNGESLTRLAIGAGFSFFLVLSPALTVGWFVHRRFYPNPDPRSSIAKDQRLLRVYGITGGFLFALALDFTIGVEITIIRVSLGLGLILGLVGSVVSTLRNPPYLIFRFVAALLIELLTAPLWPLAALDRQFGEDNALGSED